MFKFVVDQREEYKGMKKREMLVKKIKNNKIALCIALIMVLIPFIYFQGENISNFIREQIIKVQLETTYGMDFEIVSVNKSSFNLEESRDGKHKFDKDDKLYKFEAKIDDTDIKIVGYTENFSVVLCTNMPQIKYADELRKELDECIQEYISPDEYAVRYNFNDIMYFEDCTYEEFKEDFGYEYVGDVELYVKSNVTDEQILQVESLKIKKDIPLGMENYRLHANADSDFSFYKSNQGYDYLYSFDWEEQRRDFFSTLDSDSVEYKVCMESEYRYFIDYGTENEIEVLKRDNNDSFDMEMFSDNERYMLILVNDADVNSILEQYSGHTISVTDSDSFERTSEINGNNILDGNILKFERYTKKEFTQENWSEENAYKRYRMLDSFFENVDLVGMTKEDIATLLGSEKCEEDSHPNDGCNCHLSYLVEKNYKEGSKYLLLLFSDD